MRRQTDLENWRDSPLKEMELTLREPRVMAPVSNFWRCPC